MKKGEEIYFFTLPIHFHNKLIQINFISYYHSPSPADLPRSWCSCCPRPTQSLWSITSNKTGICRFQSATGKTQCIFDYLPRHRHLLPSLGLSSLSAASVRKLLLLLAYSKSFLRDPTWPYFLLHKVFIFSSEESSFVRYMIAELMRACQMIRWGWAFQNFRTWSTSKFVSWKFLPAQKEALCNK